MSAGGAGGCVRGTGSCRAAEAGAQPGAACSGGEGPAAGLCPPAPEGTSTEAHLSHGGLRQWPARSHPLLSSGKWVWLCTIGKLEVMQAKACKAPL